MLILIFGVISFLMKSSFCNSFFWVGGGVVFYVNWGKKFVSEVEGLIYKFWRMLFLFRVIWSCG